MDEFFQKLREIQKKERTNSGLARVGNDFYHRVHRYLEELRDTVGNDPFAKEQYLLRDTQRIATEICERREHKITDSAVMNIQRSYHLFKGKPQFDLQDTTPLNLTPEEEQLYFSLIDILKGYRDKIIPSLDALDDENSKIPELSVSKDSFKQKTDSKLGAVDESVIKNYLADNGTANKTIPKKDKISEEDHSSSMSNEVLLDDVPKKPNTQGMPLSQKNVQISDDQHISSDALKHSKTSSEKGKSGKINLNTLVIFDEVPSIVGVDEKVYGPFCPQDVVILPEANAQIFIKSRKGRLIRS